MCKAAEHFSNTTLIVFDLFASGKQSHLFHHCSRLAELEVCFISVYTTALSILEHCLYYSTVYTTVLSQTFKITQFV
jgi:hypothetical protein